MFVVFRKHIEFSKWFREFLGYNELTSANGEFLLEKPTPEERIVSDLAMEIGNERIFCCFIFLCIVF